MIRHIDNSMVKTKIGCDKVRIYRPSVYTDLNFIIHIDTYINNLHIHLLCCDIPYYTERFNDKIGVVNEFSNGHFNYNEYVEFYIPDVEELFGGKIYFIENLNFCDIENNTNDKNFENYILKDSSNQNFYRSLHLYNIPYKLVEIKNRSVDEDISNHSDVQATINYKKVYLPQYLFTTNKAQLSNHISVTLHPYDINTKVVVSSKKIDDYKNVYDRVVYGFNSNYNYINDTHFYENRDMFAESDRITLSSHKGFDDNGVLPIINQFNYPNKEKFSNFVEAYEYYNGVKLT